MKNLNSDETVFGQSFDLVLRFDGSIENTKLFMDENVQLILEGLLREHAVILVRVNWWTKGLTVSSEDNTHNASVTSQEPISGTLDSNP